MDFRRSKGIQHFLTNVNWEQKNVFQWRFVSIFLVKILTQFSPGDNGVNFKGGSESNIKSAWMLKEVAGLLVYVDPWSIVSLEVLAIHNESKSTPFLPNMWN